MIARLAGLLDSTGEGWCIIDVGGVGYLVFCSARTLRNLPRPGDRVSLAIDTHVREDHIHLYGFAVPAERQWFRLLQTVQGVGAKVALGLLSALSTDELAQAIASGDKASLCRADGVGGKLALRLITELKDKVAEIAAAGALPAVDAPASGMSEDAISALVNLGYKRLEAFGAVNRARQALGAKASVQTLIRAGLQELAR